MMIFKMDDISWKILDMLDLREHDILVVEN